MADKHLIYKEDLKEIVSKMVEIPTEMRVRMLGAITRAKTVDAVEVVRGWWRWCGQDRFNDAYECSECGKIAMDDSNYCPNCGAKMDGERRDGE